MTSWPAVPPGIRRALKAALFIALLAIAAWVLWSQRGELARAAAGLTPRWGLVALSCALVLAAYAILIEVWRTVLRGWGAELPFWQAARIWTISNLGRYVPGKVWQIGTMIVMAREQRVPAAAAAGSSLVVMLATTLAGFAVAIVTGGSALRLPPAALVVAALLVAAVLALPLALPAVTRLAARILGRPVTVPAISHAVVWRAMALSAAAWVLYGVAFRLLATGLLNDAAAAGTLAFYIASFVGSYLLGFVALFAPGGLVVREGAMHAALVAGGVGAADALVLVTASRVWLTLLEVLPALVFLVLGALRRERAPHAPLS